jgi:predicted CopG family antitoxin
MSERLAEYYSEIDMPEKVGTQRNETYKKIACAIDEKETFSDLSPLRQYIERKRR